MRPEIVADIGINWNGDFKLALHLIEKAREVGVDVAKFQFYDPLKLLSPADFTPTDWQCILDSQLSFEQIGMLKSYCDECEIEFMASAFDEERLGFLEELGVKRHKIASRSIYDKFYVEEVLETYKPIFVSLGRICEQNPLNECFPDTIKRLTESQHVKLLYCISEYPTKLENVHLNFDTFTFKGNKTLHGFSDHTIGITAACTALVLGAKTIEKHFTLDRDLPGPDHICSADVGDMARLCEFRDEITKVMR